jgi:hypothetical protein
MNMQDNELDDLFRSKLGGLEVEPAAHVWANIHAELGGKKKKSWVPMLNIAATVLVLITAGAWFLLNKPIKIRHRQVSRIKVTPKVSENGKVDKQQTIEPVIAEVPAGQHTSQNIASVSHAKRAKREATPISVTTVIENVDKAATQSATQVLAVVQNKPVLHAVVPEMSLTGADINEEQVLVKPINVAAPVVIAHETEKKVKKRGIHSLGGLINAVIAKVDKREDKLIEFTESDEDEANVTGINFGLIKIKKDK